MLQERLLYSNYVVVEDRPSRIDLNKSYPVEIALRCPSCREHLAPLDHGERAVCECGLAMTRWGNALECEKEE